MFDLVPELAGQRARSPSCPGGLTNANHKVATDAGAFVVRRWSDDTGLLAIDRDNEYENSVRAAEVGVGAPVVAYLPEHNTMVVGFIEGTTMGRGDLRARRPSWRGRRRRAGACTARARFRDDFDMFETQPRYLEHRPGPWLPPARRATWSSRRTPRRSARPSPRAKRRPCRATTTCWPRTSSSRGDGFRLIDYEYSGNNDACFELGNVWSESNLSLHPARAARRGLLRPSAAPQGRPRAPVGADVQVRLDPVGLDPGRRLGHRLRLLGWGMEKYDRAVAEFDEPDFERLLDEAQRPD